MANAAILEPVGSLPVAITSVAKKRPSKAALEERTLQFAANVRSFVKRLPRSMLLDDDVAQLLHSSAAVGASYIETNGAPTRQDFIQGIRSCLKAAKESSFWLRLLDAGSNESLVEFRESLAKEAQELMRIFFAILKKMKAKAA